MPTPEELARRNIDAQLERAGWIVQDDKHINRHAGPGVAVREFPQEAGHGVADYLLLVGGKAAGIVEAKPAGTTLTGVEVQSSKYSTVLPSRIPAVGSAAAHHDRTPPPPAPGQPIAA